MRILLFEDDAEVARFVRKGLQEAGHPVEHATNGRDGLFLAVSEQFDMLVLDRMLPGGSMASGWWKPCAARATGRRCCSGRQRCRRSMNG